MKKYIVGCLFIFMITSFRGYSQGLENSAQALFDSLAYAEVKDSAYVKQALASGIHWSKMKQYHDMGIDLSKLEQYKKLGIDVVRLSWGTFCGHTPQTATLHSETIVTGKIIRVDFNPSDSVACHSIYTVKVKRTLRGKRMDTIIARTTSGPLTDSIVLLVGDEEILHAGQSVLLFTDLLGPLAERGNAYYATAPEEQREMYFKHNKDMLSLRGDERCIIMSYVVKHDNLYHHGNKERLSLKQVKRMITRFSAITGST